MDEPLS